MTRLSKYLTGFALALVATLLMAAVANPPLLRNYFTTNSVFTVSQAANFTVTYATNAGNVTNLVLTNWFNGPAAYATNAGNVTNEYVTNGVYATNILAGGVAKAGLSVTNRVSIDGATTNIMVWEGGILVSNIVNQ